MWYNTIYINCKILFLLYLTLVVRIQSIKYEQPAYLTTKIYKQKLLKQLNNVHYFIITDPKILTDDLMHYLQPFKLEHKVQLYLCSHRLTPNLCKPMPLYLYINEIKIEYNGRKNNNEDLRKWIRWRLEEYPHRIRSLDQLRQHAVDKNEVFCFIDRQGQQMTRKQYIFIATAKQLHFLFYLDFCFLDVTVAKQLHLKQGHLVLFRRDLTFNYDYYSQRRLDSDQQLNQLWLSFLYRSYQSTFRVESRNKSHNLVTFQVDQSLECQEQLMDLLKYELQWRKKHPQINFNIKFLQGKTGQHTFDREHTYDYPLIKYGQTKVTKKIVHQNGAVLEETHYQRDSYVQGDVVIDEGTIQRLLDQYRNDKLRFIITDSSIDIRPLQGEQAEPYRQAQRKRLQQQQTKLKTSSTTKRQEKIEQNPSQQL